MKKLLIPFIVFLISLSANAQRPKSEFAKRVDSINSILYQTKRVMFINNEGDGCSLKKIIAHKSGSVFSQDSLNTDAPKSKHEIFNLLEVHRFERKGNQLVITRKDKQRIGAIMNIRVQDMKTMKELFDALHFIAEMYAKEDPKYKCDLEN